VLAGSPDHVTSNAAETAQWLLLLSELTSRLAIDACPLHWVNYEVVAHSEVTPFARALV